MLTHILISTMLCGSCAMMYHYRNQSMVLQSTNTQSSSFESTKLYHSYVPLDGDKPWHEVYSTHPLPYIAINAIVSGLSMVSHENTHYGLNGNRQLTSRPRYVNCIIFMYHWTVTNHGTKYIVLILFPISPLMLLLAA